MQSLGPRTPLVLGSASPRRRALLAEVGVPLRVEPVDVDESVRTGESPDAYLERVVRLKLKAASMASPDGTALLVADTVVIVDGAILGKPPDIAGAAGMLRRIVGRAHVVKTRYAIAVTPRLERAVVERTVETIVRMRSATTAEIERYAASGEGLDKAGAYAAQGKGSFLVEAVEGSYTSVVGLPVCEVVQDLQRLGLLGALP